MKKPETISLYCFYCGEYVDEGPRWMRREKGHGRFSRSLERERYSRNGD